MLFVIGCIRRIKSEWVVPMRLYFSALLLLPAIVLVEFLFFLQKIYVNVFKVLMY